MVHMNKETHRKNILLRSVQGNYLGFVPLVLQPHGKLLSVEDEYWNESVACNQIIVKIFLVILQNCGV